MRTGRGIGAHCAPGAVAQQRRIGDIDLRHVLDDGDESVAQWREAHEEYWHSAETREVLGDPGFTVDDDTAALAQRFRLVRAL